MNRNGSVNVAIALVIVAAIVAALPLYALLFAFGWTWRFWINANVWVLGFQLYAGEEVSPISR